MKKAIDGKIVHYYETSYFDKRLKPWAEKNLLNNFKINMNGDTMIVPCVTIKNASGFDRIETVATDLGEKAIDTLTENQVLTFSDFTKL